MRTATRPAQRLGALAIAVAFLGAALAGCTGEEDAPADISVSAGTAAPSPTPSAAEPRAVTLDLVDTDERADIERRLTEAGFTVDSGDEHGTTRITADADVEGLTAPRQAFALVVHQRSAVYDLTLDEATALLRGMSDLGQDLAVADQAQDWLDRAYPVPNRFVRTMPATAVIDEVADNESVVGLIPASELTASVRALTIAGHDPYRDPWMSSPLLDLRTVAGPDADAVVRALGWDTTSLPDPIGFLATGELIPARCVSERVAALAEGYDAIFDGTRDLIGAADIAIAHWPSATTSGTAGPAARTSTRCSRRAPTSRRRGSR